MKITLDKINRDLKKAVELYGHPSLTIGSGKNYEGLVHVQIDGVDIPCTLYNRYLWKDCMFNKDEVMHGSVALQKSNLYDLVCIRWYVKDKRKMEIIKVFNDMLNYVSNLYYKSYF